jgi:hypothetical protein
MNSSRVNLQHRPFLTPIWITAAAAGAAFLFASFLIWLLGTAGSTTVIVIPVSPTGDKGPAAQLARMFGPEGSGRLEAIYVAPLAEQLHIEPRDAPRADPKSIARLALREHAGDRVLIVADPGVFAKVVESLSGAHDIMDPSAGHYGVIYVVTVPRIGHANLVRFNY